MIFVFEIRIRKFQISRFDSRFVFDISNLRFGFEIRIRIFQISRFDSRFGFDIWNLRFGFDIRIRVMRILYSSWKFDRISNIYIRIFVEYKYSPTFGSDSFILLTDSQRQRISHGHVKGPDGRSNVATFLENQRN